MDSADHHVEREEVRTVPVAAAVPAAKRPKVTERFLVFDDVRVQLTLAYLREHNDPDIDPKDPIGTFMDPKVVVLHWTGGSTTAGAVSTFTPSTLGGRPDLQGAGALNVAAHFLVDRDGQITQLLESTRIGRHTIGLNHISIGIENVGFEPDHPLTGAQVSANASLIRWLHSRHGLIHVIGHHEYRDMEGHPYFIELDPNYRTAKMDPGDAFVSSVLQELQDLQLLRASSSKSAP